VVRHSQYGFDWTRFPLHIRSARKLTLNETPLVTVIGKAFWDVGHAAVNAMLLSEFLKAHRKVQEQEATIARLTSTDAKQEAMIATSKSRLKRLLLDCRKSARRLK
jgi:hypothetical protein